MTAEWVRAAMMPRPDPGFHHPPDNLSDKPPDLPESLPLAVWRTTVGDQVISHAVRGDHTLCGLDAQAYDWTDPPDQGRRCSACASVPEGHFTHHCLLATGISYRQLDYWVRIGLIFPDNATPGSGRRRTFPPEEAQVVALMAPLVLDAGLDPSIAARAARNDGWVAPGIRINWGYVGAGIYDVPVVTAAEP